jgi:autotransporter translocation and assembly factor TamB
MSLCSFIMVFLFACGSNGGGTSSNTNSQNPVVGESSANTNAANSQNPLAGTWVSGGYSLTFKSDNTYSRNFNLDDVPAVRGSVTVSGNVIIVTDSDSCISSTTGETTSGSYTYTMSGNTLTFSLFHDPCSDRAAFLGLTYTKQ